MNKLSQKTAIFCLFLFYWFLANMVWAENTSKLPANAELATIIAPNGKKILVEIADTPAKRSQGLMFRTTMPADHGMLFVFDKLDRWIFWMKNTRMPLDLIWLGPTHKVVHLEPSVPICTRTDEGCPRYRSLKEAQYVLELGAGRAKEFKITPNSQLTITFPEDSQPASLK